MSETLSEKEMVAIQDLLMDKLNVKREQLTPEARIQEDLGADSIDTVDIIMGLEEEFELTIPDDAAERVGTVRDAYTLVAELLGRSAAK
jgi:acyl carrier protein